MAVLEPAPSLSGRGHHLELVTWHQHGVRWLVPILWMATAAPGWWLEVTASLFYAQHKQEACIWIRRAEDQSSAQRTATSFAASAYMLACCTVVSTFLHTTLKFHSIRLLWPLQRPCGIAGRGLLLYRHTNSSSRRRQLCHPVPWTRQSHSDAGVSRHMCKCWTSLT